MKKNKIYGPCRTICPITFRVKFLKYDELGDSSITVVITRAERENCFGFFVLFAYIKIE